MSHTPKLAFLLRPFHLAVFAMAIATCSFAAPIGDETKTDPRQQAAALIREGNHAEGVAIYQTIIKDSATETAVRFSLGLRTAEMLRHPLGQIRRN